MPKKIDPALRERAVRLVTEHQQEYSSLTAASEAVARQLGVGKESVRRWVVQAQIDDGQRPGVTTEGALPPCSGHGICGYAATGSVAGVRVLS